MGIDLDDSVVGFINSDVKVSCTDAFGKTLGTTQGVLGRVIGAKIAGDEELVHDVLVRLRCEGLVTDNSTQISKTVSVIPDYCSLEDDSGHGCNNSSDCSTISSSGQRQKEAACARSSAQVVPHPEGRSVRNFFDRRVQFDSEVVKRVDLFCWPVLEVDSSRQGSVSGLTLNQRLFLRWQSSEAADIDVGLDPWEPRL